MPITLGCPSCGKRFRARDESVGKRVKCPFCQAAVPVPSAEEAHHAAAPTDLSAPALEASPATPPTGAPGLPARDARPAAGPTPAAAVTPGDWGAEDAATPPIVLEEEPPAPPFTPPAAAGSKPVRPVASPAAPKDRPAKPAESPLEAATAAWRKARGGLLWVQFGLFWFALIGAVPFGKMVYERSVGELPKGPGWVKIDGYVNTPDRDAVQISKREEINLLAYGVPVLLGGLCLVFGRVTCGAAPRSSGAKGLFVFSGLATLVALTAALTMPVCEKSGFTQVYGYARSAVLVCLPLGEFWFLIALAAAGATLRRPAAVRSVGLFALVVGLAAAVIIAGWDAWLKYGVQIGRPKVPDADWLLYEEAAKMLGWLLVIGMYGRAVRATRWAIRDHLDSVEDQREPRDPARPLSKKVPAAAR
jgi:hypothetical protein